MLITNKYNPFLGFNDFWSRVIGIPIIAFFIPMLFFGHPFVAFIDYLPEWGQSMLYTLLYWESSRFIMIRMRKRFPNIEDARKRLIITGVLVIVTTKIIGIGLKHLIEFSAGIFIGNWEYEHMHEEPFTATIFIYAMLVTITSIYESIYFYSQLKQSIVEKEQAVQDQIRSQLQGLRNQVNPHFLFNSLNTLSSIVEEDKNLAVRFVQKLSKVYRYILEFREEAIIPLREELEFIHAYIFLQEERFRGKFTVHIDLPKEYLEQGIVPLSMQILFENAIKHNVISTRKPLIIKVFVEGGKIVVSNNLQLKQQVMDSTKVGIENIRNRYKFITKEEVTIIKTAEEFMVKLPLIPSPFPIREF